MRKKKSLAIVNVVSFLLLAFSVSFDFKDPVIELICLISGLIGAFISAFGSIFNRDVWNASHGPEADQYKGAFGMLVSIIFLLIIFKAILSSFHLIPTSLDVMNFGIWIVGYAAMVSPNLMYIFEDHTNSKSERA